MLLLSVSGARKYECAISHFVGYYVYWLVIQGSVFAEPNCRQVSETSCKISCSDIPGHGDVNVDLTSIDGSSNEPRYGQLPHIDMLLSK